MAQNVPTWDITFLLRSTFWPRIHVENTRGIVFFGLFSVNKTWQGQRSDVLQQRKGGKGLKWKKRKTHGHGQSKNSDMAKREKRETTHSGQKGAGGERGLNLILPAPLTVLITRAWNPWEHIKPTQLCSNNMFQNTCLVLETTITRDSNTYTRTTPTIVRQAEHTYPPAQLHAFRAPSTKIEMTQNTSDTR